MNTNRVKKAKMGEEESGERKAEPSSSAAVRKRVESLGWLTESTIMPKKHRSIEGVGPSSILELNAQLYKSQEEAKRAPKEPLLSTDTAYAHHLQVHRAKHKIDSTDRFSSTNPGVSLRAAKYPISTDSLLFLSIRNPIFMILVLVDLVFKSRNINYV